MLRFTRIQLRNWRNFKIVDVPIQERAFLVGPNASGKSNFLDALRFLYDLVSVGGGFQQAVQKRGGVSKLRCMAARKSPDIAIQVQINDESSHVLWDYQLEFNQDNQSRPQIKSESVKKNGEVILQRPDGDDQQDNERLSQSHIEQVYANREIRDLASFFRSVRYLHIVPQLVRETERSMARANDPYGGDFLEQIAKSNRLTQQSRLKKITDALIIAIPQLQELKLEKDERGVPHLSAKYRHWRSQGMWLDEDQFSDGTLRLMGLLWSLLDGTGPLLLEEPELSLHPGIVRMLPQMFAHVNTRLERQVLMSSHSNELLTDSGIGLDEVLIFQPAEEGTKVLLASQIPHIQTLHDGDLSLADAVMPLTSPGQVAQLSQFANK